MGQSFIAADCPAVTPTLKNNVCKSQSMRVIFCTHTFYLVFFWRGGADLEKAASGANSACGHFVVNHSILRTFLAKYPVLFTEDEKEELKMEN